MHHHHHHHHHSLCSHYSLTSSLLMFLHPSVPLSFLLLHTLLLPFVLILRVSFPLKQCPYLFLSPYLSCQFISHFFLLLCLLLHLSSHPSFFYFCSSFIISIPSTLFFINPRASFHIFYAPFALTFTPPAPPHLSSISSHVQG